MWVGELRGTAVSRSLRLTGDITLRHGWRDRGTEGTMVIHAEKCHCPDTTVTHTHTNISYTHAHTHKKIQDKGVWSLWERKSLATVGRDEAITSSPFKKGGDRNKETKQKKRLRVTDYTIMSQQPFIYSYQLLSKHNLPSFGKAISFFTFVAFQSPLCCFH